MGKLADWWEDRQQRIADQRWEDRIANEKAREDTCARCGYYRYKHDEDGYNGTCILFLHSS